MEAVKQMGIMLDKACLNVNMTLNDLDLIIPHQANQRIIDAITKRNNLRPGQLFSNIKDYGNTSSNSIPVCLAQIWESFEKDQTIGLCAFGGGFTFGATTMKKA